MIFLRFWQGTYTLPIVYCQKMCLLPVTLANLLPGALEIPLYYHPSSDMLPSQQK
jgi:hypothetical protein